LYGALLSKELAGFVVFQPLSRFALERYFCPFQCRGTFGKQRTKEKLQKVYKSVSYFSQPSKEVKTTFRQ
jgi:hypothetical protein